MLIFQVVTLISIEIYKLHQDFSKKETSKTIMLFFVCLCKVGNVFLKTPSPFLKQSIITKIGCYLSPGECNRFKPNDLIFKKLFANSDVIIGLFHLLKKRFQYS